jgi:Tfp pilus assembly protein PilO
MDNELTRKYEKALYVTLGIAATLALALLVMFSFVIGPKPERIKKHHIEIIKLQEKLISTQITANQLNHVQTLIKKNLAYSAMDTLAQGASLSFLKDLANVLDKLKINLISLEPVNTILRGEYIETPYRMELICNYHQLCQLVNKMEKSPRLISVKKLKVENYFDDYFSKTKYSMDQCNVSMEATTLTLIKGAI